jgi:DNA-binding protein YbaB
MDWGFEEDDEAEDVRRGTPAEESTDDTGPLSGQDARGVVTITVTEAAAITSVRLARDWRDRGEPRELGGLVREAANNATASAVATRAQQVDIRAEVEAGTAGPARTSQPSEEERPITREDARRLLDAVTADLTQFRQRMSAVVDEMVREDSAGEHVTVSGRRGQVMDVSLDVSWLFTARESEIESELRDALTRFADRSTPGELAQGPQSSAISELMALVSDPQAMVRRIAMRNRRS